MCTKHSSNTLQCLVQIFMKQKFVDYYFFLGLNYFLNNEVEWHHYDAIHYYELQPIHKQQ